MTDDKTRPEDEKCLAMIEERLSDHKKRNTLIVCGLATIVLALGAVTRCQDEKREEEVGKQTKANVENIVHQNVVNAYPGPAAFETPYRQSLKQSAQRHGIRENLLEGLIIASSEENPNHREIPEEYRSIIALNPETVGVLSKYLKTDPTLAIEQAARLYASIREREKEEAKAVATFFAGREGVARAVREEQTKLDGIYDRAWAYERMFHIFLDNELRQKPLNWIDNLAPWQREATYIALTHIGMHISR